LPKHKINIEAGDRVLFIAIRAMGDTLLATPLIRDFKAEYPETSIEVIVQSLPAQILEGNKNISNLLISPTSGSWIGAYRKLYYQLWKSNYKLSIDLISTPGSAVLSFIANARTRIGYNIRGRTWAYTDPVKRQSITKYSAITKYDLAVPIELHCTSPIPEIFPEAQYKTWAIERLSELKIDSTKTLIGLCPWSKREWRRWDINNWTMLLTNLKQTVDTQVILFASASERIHLSGLESISDISVCWGGATHIHQVAALMSQCQFIFTADNGLKHIGVAVNTPTFTIYTDYDGVAPSAWNPPDNNIHEYIIADFNIDDNSPVIQNACNFLRGVNDR
jgi:ADP-heptose:LPS heptosyltransferase